MCCAVVLAYALLASCANLATCARMRKLCQPSKADDPLRPAVGCYARNFQYPAHSRLCYAVPGHWEPPCHGASLQYTCATLLLLRHSVLCNPSTRASLAACVTWLMSKRCSMCRHCYARSPYNCEHLAICAKLAVSMRATAFATLLPVLAAFATCAAA